LREDDAVTAEVALHRAAEGSSWPGRLVCVSVNTSIDKIAAVDRLRPGEIHRPEILSMVPGGKALNVARPAASLGMPVRAVAVLGGHAGDWVDAALRGQAIGIRAVRIAGETRTCLSVLDRETGTLTEFYEPGLTLDARGWAAVESALAAELADDPAGSLVILSGSLPPGAPVDGYARLTTLAKRAGARAVVDADRDVLDEALAARPWLVKVNAREAAVATGLAGTDETVAVSAARALRTRTSGAVLVTRGLDGAVVVDDTGVAWRVGAPPAQGRYPVGSGDSLLAGLVVALASGHALPEAARRGGAVGAANALVPGQGELDLADADRMLSAISVERLG
jgi:1-phosphofructokinase family hexose kinase